MSEKYIIPALQNLQSKTHTETFKETDRKELLEAPHNFNCYYFITWDC